MFYILYDKENPSVQPIFCPSPHPRWRHTSWLTKQHSLSLLIIIDRRSCSACRPTWRRCRSAQRSSTEASQPPPPSAPLPTSTRSSSPAQPGLPSGASEGRTLWLLVNVKVKEQGCYELMFFGLCRMYWWIQGPGSVCTISGHCDIISDIINWRNY